MIVRMWRGWIRTEQTERYIDYIEQTGLSEYRRTPGNAGAQMLTRDLGDGRTEVVTLSWWPDLEHVKAFAGDDVEVAKYYPEDDEFLVERENVVRHFTLAEPDASAVG
jgi:heme-degrading monooxygenase HmoA